MKKMNIKFLAGTAFAVSAAAALAGCGMPEPTVYGPAPTELVETTEETSTEETVEETTEKATGETTAQETFETETEIEATLYGPPADYQWEPVTQDVNGFDPETEVQEDVYGPPEWFE